MAFWLLKTEPSRYAFADLERDRRTRWDGVTNAQAQSNLRAMREGDGVAIYHSGARESVGLARVARGAYPDPGDRSGRRVAVVAALPGPVGLGALRDEPAFAGSPLLRQGRLSVVPLTAPQWKALRRLARRGAVAPSLGE
jgi:predicted RNA-binding protein with PUA-like domain